MSVDTGIEWTDSTWNPLRGCSRVSEGCRHCYAETVAARFSGPGQPYEGLATRTPSGPRWTGTVRLIEDHLTDPLRWKKPRKVFVNSMSDLFHESVPDEWIDRIFAVMTLSPQHTFQVLTKRPDRMREYFDGLSRTEAGGVRALGYRIGNLLNTFDLPSGRSFPRTIRTWPLPNVWLGVSCEDQKTADERIPLLLKTPAAVRFISAEPLLGSVDLYRGGFTLLERIKSPSGTVWPGLDWVIVGGESGPHARPCDLAWIRSLVQQCNSAGTACFVKQLGASPFYGGVYCGYPNERFGEKGIYLKDRKGGDMTEWPEDLRGIREFPRVPEAISA